MMLIKIKLRIIEHLAEMKLIIAADLTERAGQGDTWVVEDERSQACQEGHTEHSKNHFLVIFKNVL